MDTENFDNFPKRLAAFDFDQTIVLENTDIVVRDLIRPNSIPNEITNLIDKEGWTRYMEEIFIMLHEKVGVKPDKILKTIRDIFEVPGMVRCLKTLHKMNFDLIIISDSNSEFINEWNRSHGLSNVFSKIFTNPAWFENDGLLKIQPFHHQTDCNLSSKNLCKGSVLQNYIKDCCDKNYAKYDSIFYVGDGSNDICPVLRLSQNDYGCSRSGFSMDKKLKKNAFHVKADLISWENGFDLLGKILEKIK